MSAYSGAKVHLKTSDGLYAGIVHTVDPVQKKISLKKVIVLPCGKELVGIHNFFSSDIVDLEVVDISDKPDKITSSRTRPDGNRDITAQQVVCSTQSDNDKDGHSPDHNQYPETVSSKPRKVGKSVYQAEDLFIFTRLDDRYHEAVKNLQEQTVLGLAMEGIDLGRNGTLSLIQFSTQDRLYIFDIKLLGKKAFNTGIGEIIEDEGIVKVIHDCRPLSDLLYHQYSLRLANVFDTQVADVIVWKREHFGNLPSRVKSLPACLMEYLDNIEPESVNFMMLQQKCIQEDPQLWEERPLENKLLKYADRRVRNLLELRNIQMKDMMKDFRTGVMEYLSIWRDKTSTREKKPISMYESVPRSFARHHQVVALHQEPTEEGECYFDRDNIKQPGYWSRDAWKEGSQFHGDDDDKYAWFREMQSQQAASNGVAAGLEQEKREIDDLHQQNMSSRNPHHKPRTQKLYEVNTRGCFKSNPGETAFKPRLNEKTDPIIQTSQGYRCDGVKSNSNSSRFNLANDESSYQSSSSLPSSSDEILNSTSNESSPCIAPSLKTTSIYRGPSENAQNNFPATSEKKNHSQIRELTLKNISREFKMTSHSPPPLIASDVSSDLDERIPCVERVPASTDHMSYAMAVSGESSMSKSGHNSRPESPNPLGKKIHTGRGRGNTIKSYREILGNCQKLEETPVAVLRGNAVRCDFPSDNVVKNAPRGITVSKDSRISGLAKS